jgi:hypothetical protein
VDRELEATAALVFADAPPANVELGPDESRSYAEWLGQRPATAMTLSREHAFARPRMERLGSA